MANDVVFEERSDRFKLPVGCTKVYGKIIFNVSMDLTPKTCFVASGHMLPHSIKITMHDSSK